MRVLDQLKRKYDVSKKLYVDCKHSLEFSSTDDINELQVRVRYFGQCVGAAMC